MYGNKFSLMDINICVGAAIGATDNAGHWSYHNGEDVTV